MMVGPIFVLAEHRAGELRDITFEMLTKGHELAEGLGTELVAILLGHEVDGMAQELAKWANRVLYVSDPLLKNFNADAYQAVLAHLIGERKPILTMIGHTAYGIDVAPSLAVQLGLPIATDCLDLCFEDGRLCVVRQVYGGKVNVRARLKEASSYIVTVRQAAFQPGEYGPLSGEVERVECPIKEEPKGRKFIGIVTPPPGAVDITAADVIVSVGRGIRDKENIPMIEELAELLGGVVALSLKLVGGLLVYAFVVNSASTALQLSYDMKKIFLLSPFIGMLAFLSGFGLSLWLDLPVGSSIVLTSSIMLATSIALSPKRKRG